ncbi:MAG TPA: hypothetical protein QF753_17940 [Victivallales bacterium]|nr:hypothetical protein [Victivallales bacterium]
MAILKSIKMKSKKALNNYFEALNNYGEAVSRSCSYPIRTKNIKK